MRLYHFIFFPSSLNVICHAPLILLLSFVFLLLVFCPLSTYPLPSKCTAYSKQSGCADSPSLKSPLPNCFPYSSSSTDPLSSHIADSSFLFAIVGDFGLNDGGCASRVSELMKQIEKQYGKINFVLSTGDNAYWSGDCQSFHNNVGRFFGDYVNDSVSCYNDRPNVPAIHAFPSARANQLPSSIRFFPTLGNHDWDDYSKKNVTNLPYTQFFPYLQLLPGGNISHGQYYTYKLHPLIQLWSLNSNLGVDPKKSSNYNQHLDMIKWAKESILSSTAVFKIVLFHHSVHSTAQHDRPASWMDLPYSSWGVDIVLTGHQHAYERTVIDPPNRIKSGNQVNNQYDGMPYILNGLGGHLWLYDNQNCKATPGSKIRYNSYHGILLGKLKGIYSKDEDNSNNDTGGNTKRREKGILPVVDMCFLSLESGGKIVDQFKLKSRHGDIYTQ